MFFEINTIINLVEVESIGPPVEPDFPNDVQPAAALDLSDCEFLPSLVKLGRALLEGGLLLIVPDPVRRAARSQEQHQHLCCKLHTGLGELQNHSFRTARFTAQKSIARCHLT